MANATLSKDLLSDQAYALLRSAIVSGEHAPGERLVESVIARDLGISQAPVREAVKRLAHEGLVTSEPRRGSYVTAIEPGEFEIARELRAALEQISGRVAAVEATPADLEYLRSVVEQMRQALASGEVAEFRGLDMGFHAYVIGIAKRRVLDRVWTTLEPLLVSQRVIGDPEQVGDRERVVHWHEELVEALESRDPEVAGQAFLVHARGQLD